MCCATLSFVNVDHSILLNECVSQHPNVLIFLVCKTLLNWGLRVAQLSFLCTDIRNTRLLFMHRCLQHSPQLSYVSWNTLLDRVMKLAMSNLLHTYSFLPKSFTCESLSSVLAVFCSALCAVVVKQLAVRHMSLCMSTRGGQEYRA